MGLEKDCLSCHPDEHHGQLAKDCLTCHIMAGWKPASAFDHSKAKYILTGKHTDVTCVKCHPSLTNENQPSGKAYTKFTGLQFQKCLDCHKDVHNNKFGQNCESCHNTSSWTSVNQTKFDHSKTQYPLELKHVSVACNKCHVPGKPLAGLKFKLCTDCHGDYHRGDFASREKKGACEECHTLAGFEITKFTVDEHQKTKYQLAGSHLAVPCDGCHKKVILNGNNETVHIKFESTRCQVCHTDPHKGAVDNYMPKGGCEYCHLVENWRASSYDHSQAKFVLDGKHKTIACKACHQKKGTDPPLLQFTELAQNCQGCHDDIHRGQFVQVSSTKDGSSKDTECNRCHTAVAWKTLKFDHSRDSKFILDGAHIKLLCIQCHKPEMIDGKAFIKYKPLGSKCSDCHGGQTIQTGAGQS